MDILECLRTVVFTDMAPLILLLYRFPMFSYPPLYCSACFSYVHCIKIIVIYLTNDIFLILKSGREPETRGHTFNFEDVQVLATEIMEHPRKVLEGIYTKINQNTIDRGVRVPTYYQSIVGTCKSEGKFHR